MVRLIIALLLSLSIVNAVGFEDRREMLNCYLAKPEVMEIGQKVYWYIVDMGLQENTNWDLFVTTIRALDDFQVTIFTSCSMSLKKLLISASGSSADTIDLLTDLAYIVASAEAIILENGGLK